MACSDDSPLSSRSRFIDEGGGCFLAGLIVHFTDSVSYEYAMAFLAQFDSIKVEETYMGIELTMYADSADYEYWNNLFRPDSSFFDLHIHTFNDSLTLLFIFLSDQYYSEHKSRIFSNPYLVFVDSLEQDNSVFISVPDSSEFLWEETLSSYDFVEQASIIGICND